MTRKTCKGCIYLRPVSESATASRMVCHYLLDTYRVRPCPADRCAVKVTEKKPTHRQLDLYGGEIGNDA